MQILQMDELIRRIEIIDGSLLGDHDTQDPLEAEIRQVLDHLRGVLDSQLHGGLQPPTADPSARADLWYH